MTTTQPAPPILGAVACARQIHELLGHAVVDPDTDTLAQTIRAIDTALNALQALRLDVIAGAIETGAILADGHASPSAWLAQHTHSTGPDAARAVALARQLDQLPAVHDALTAGTISISHARVLADIATTMAESLPAADREAALQCLTTHATEMNPAELRKTARRYLASLDTHTPTDDAENSMLATEEESALAATRLTLHDNTDGTLTGHFTIPAFVGAQLRALVQQLSSPRRQATRNAPGCDTAAVDPAAVDPAAVDTAAVDTGYLTTDWAHEYGLAFVELLEHLPTDRLHHAVPATIVVTMTTDIWQGQQKVVTTSLGEPVSAGHARRLACQARIMPAVLDGASLPLDLGRSQRLFNQAQRIALATRYHSCAATDCDRPYAWCEHHHEEPWAHNGTTDLHNDIPLCAAHHRMIHDQHHRHRVHRRPDGTKRVQFQLRT